MRFIKEETTIPLPEVYAFDTTSENEIGVPYIVMSFIDGFTVNSLWFDNTGPTPLEERRLRTLDTLAEAMSQLQKFQFDKIGSLQFNNGTDSIEIGPCYMWDEGHFSDEDWGENITVKPFGPFKTSQSYLEYCLNNDGCTGHKDPYKLGIGSRKLLAVMISCLPCPRKSLLAGEKFVLSLPDFNPQNILIDERGNLTGITDWENVQTVPRFLGYSSFPSWITRDWDPLMYHYPVDGVQENSPEELKQYRRRYNRRMKELLNGKGDSIYD
jgi:aminoglycoside phosphotransferase (APT) family kinase protein